MPDARSALLAWRSKRCNDAPVVKDRRAYIDIFRSR